MYSLVYLHMYLYISYKDTLKVTGLQAFLYFVSSVSAFPKHYISKALKVDYENSPHNFSILRYKRYSFALFLVVIAFTMYPLTCNLGY